MAQAILDCFPDAVSQFGLLGCAAWVCSMVLILSLVWMGTSK
jgi:hypothetical protein